MADLMEFEGTKEEKKDLGHKALSGKVDSVFFLLCSGSYVLTCFVIVQDRALEVLADRSEKKGDVAKANELRQQAQTINKKKKAGRKRGHGQKEGHQSTKYQCLRHDDGECRADSQPFFTKSADSEGRFYYQHYHYHKNDPTPKKRKDTVTTEQVASKVVKNDLFSVSF
jgi:hypothetical protein